MGQHQLQQQDQTSNRWYGVIRNNARLTRTTYLYSVVYLSFCCAVLFVPHAEKSTDAGRLPVTWLRRSVLKQHDTWQYGVFVHSIQYSQLLRTEYVLRSRISIVIPSLQPSATLLHPSIPQYWHSLFLLRHRRRLSCASVSCFTSEYPPDTRYLTNPLKITELIEQYPPPSLQLLLTVIPTELQSAQQHILAHIFPQSRSRSLKTSRRRPRELSAPLPMLPALLPMLPHR